MQSLEKNDIPVEGFIDQKAEEKFHVFNQKKIELLAEVKPSDDLLIVVAIFHDAKRLSVQQWLEGLNYRVLIYDPYACIHAFYTTIAARRVDNEKFAKSINNLQKLYAFGEYKYGNLGEDLFVAPLVTANVTQKCNHKSVDCGQAIPYYENPKEFNTDSVISEITTFCKQVDLVPEISLHGGEPFLNTNIGEICIELSKIPNLVFINIVTNGSILPAPEVWPKLAMAGVDMHQSNYGRISKKRDPVFELCQKHNIYCDTDFVFDHKNWVRIKVRDYGRSASENKCIYETCVSTSICAQIMDGKLYRCPISAHWGAQVISSNLKERISYRLLVLKI